MRHLWYTLTQRKRHTATQTQACTSFAPICLANLVACGCACLSIKLIRILFKLPRALIERRIEQCARQCGGKDERLANVQRDVSEARENARAA